MAEVLKIKTISSRSEGKQIEISPSSGPPWMIRFSGLGEFDQVIAAEDLFEALKILRKQVEDRGEKLLCAGARRDVYPSGMGRSMGGARKAYIMELGEPGRKIVDIFDYAQPDQVGTVTEQEQFRNLWIASLIRRQ